MWFLGVQSLIVATILAKESSSFPFRGVSSRSVPGRIRATEPETIKDYLYNYLLQQQQQQQQQLNRLPYSVPEYEPIYQEGYISRRPQISPETLAAVLPFLSSQAEVPDYAYDYSSGGVGLGSPPTAYTDDDGAWYDEDAGLGSDFPPSPSVDARDKNNQEAALLQLFVDHLAGKYSLEDLETLERQAVLEDNTENQLQALMPRKKSAFPFLGARGLSARTIIGFPDRKGQKEEPFVIPASSVRKPVFTRSAPSGLPQKTLRTNLPKASAHSTSAPASHVRAPPHSSTSPSSPSSGESNKSSAVDGSRSPPLSHRFSAATASTASPAPLMTTMEPALKSAYDDFMAYLDQERYLRKTADEAKQQRHSQQKRFVSDPQSLTQQLASLKKNVT